MYDTSFNFVLLLVNNNNNNSCLSDEGHKGSEHVQCGHCSQCLQNEECGNIMLGARIKQRKHTSGEVRYHWRFEVAFNTYQWRRK